MPCSGPDCDHARTRAAEAWSKVKDVLMSYGLTVNTPEGFGWMSCRKEFDAVRDAIEELFVRDACNTW